jgi:D-alanyl-D-alanine carboxypeptidase/D-alanyl-D-alanine-endopeptidase (penicillin-binding protein 4)
MLRRKGVTYTTGDADMAPAPHTEYALQTRPANVTNKIFSCTRTVDQILQKMMKDSDNLYAESMFYLLAAHGGKRHVEWEDGAHRVDSIMRRVDTWAMAEVADGSGLSLYNYVSPRTMTLMLRYAYLNPNIYNYFMPSLPLAGVDGTLEHRMQDGTAHRNVRAKTGTVSGVSTLAGYCRASNGHLLAFTIMNNGLIKTAVARRFQDRLCQELTK